jgi:pyruvate/2-oxoglutarate dehydrogenase complex dihydrolipoamide acyltransferase (E2) component
MTIIDMDALSRSAPRTHRTVVKELNLRETSGEVDIDLHKLPQYTRGEVFGWLAAYHANTHKAAKQPEPAAAPPPPPPAPTEPQINMADLEAENQRDMKARADEAAAKARLQQLADQEGLEESTANVEAIRQFLRQHLRGYLSAEGVNAAFANLGPRGSNVLTFKKVQPPLAPTPTEPVERLEPWQLRIDATEAEMKKADVKALKDLLARRRAKSNQQYIRRGFSTKF